MESILRTLCVLKFFACRINEIYYQKMASRAPSWTETEISHTTASVSTLVYRMKIWSVFIKMNQRKLPWRSAKIKTKICIQHNPYTSKPFCPYTQTIWISQYNCILLLTIISIKKRKKNCFMVRIRCAFYSLIVTDLWHNDAIVEEAGLLLGVGTLHQ